MKKIIFNFIAAVTVPGTYKLDGKDLNNLKIVKFESKQLVVKNSDNQEIPFYAE